MMKAKALRWIKVRGAWHRAGTVVELTEAEAEKLAGAVDLIEAPAPAVPAEETEQPEKPKRSRSRKKAE